MIEAALRIKRLERQVMWRARLLALQDRIALMILISCSVAAGFVLFARLKEGGKIPWSILLAIFAIVLAALSFNWIKTRASERQAAFVIDNALGLEDRIITAHEIIERSGPKKIVETALIEDAATRVTDQRASSVIAYRQKKWHALSLVGVIALIAAVMIPEKALPGGEAIAEARADIQAAGEQLEQAATEAEAIAPAESETASLAKEQADLGRSFRRSSVSRAEALKKLSSLEGRIRQRHDTLAETRADEIVNIAEQRMRAALSPKPKQRAEAAANEKDDASEQAAESQNAESRSDAKSTQPNARSSRSDRTNAKPDSTNAQNAKSSDQPVAQKANANQATPNKSDAKSDLKPDAKSDLAANAKPNSEGQAAQPTPPNELQKPVSSPNSQSRSDNKNSAANQKERDQNSPEAAAAGENAGAQKAGEQKEGEQKEGEQKEQGKDEQKPEGTPSVANPIGGLVAEQAAKAMSQELLNKAAQLRAGQLSAEDIKRLAQAAQFLAQDLKQIAQSKELQQALEQMVRQIGPEQLEQVARQLMNQEQLKRELEAAARLMMQNQQAKEMVAGLKKSAEDFAKQFRGLDSDEQKGKGRGAGGDGAPNGKSSPGANARLQLGRPADSEKLKGRGKETNASGNLQRGTGGEYLYLQTQAGAGAARAPYSTAYPQYRREAERSVQRSQVPPHMRSMVRSYFDAINPDASKKP